MIIDRHNLKILSGYDYYQGNIIHKPFAYKVFRNKTLPHGNIVAFRAPMKVETEGMIDEEDLLTNDFIYSDDAINFIWEIPHLDSFGAVAFQRLFNTQIATILNSIINKPIEVDGDDLLVIDEFEGSDGKLQKSGKVSVSIAYSKNNIALCHTGINVNAGMLAPSFAYSSKMSDEQCDKFMEAVINEFYRIIDDISVATRKINIA